MDLPRSTYYGKELDLRLSRSYGPGRYDREYEERGLDYPIGYVRWTERRNIAAFLDLVASGRVGHRAAGHRAHRRSRRPRARTSVWPRPSSRRWGSWSGTTSTPLDGVPLPRSTGHAAPAPGVRPRRRVGVIGAGSFAQGTMIPGLRSAGFTLEAVASATGRSAHGAAGQFGFQRVLGVDELLADPGVDVVAIASRHATHADLAVRALEAGKAVFVEKPPCLNVHELEALRAAVGRVRPAAGGRLQPPPRAAGHRAA